MKNRVVSLGMCLHRVTGNNHAGPREGLRYAITKDLTPAFLVTPAFLACAACVPSAWGATVGYIKLHSLLKFIVYSKFFLLIFGLLLFSINNANASDIKVKNQQVTPRVLCTIYPPFNIKQPEFIPSPELTALRKNRTAHAMRDLIKKNSAYRLKLFTIAAPKHLLFEREPVFWVEGEGLTLALEVGAYGDDGAHMSVNSKSTKPQTHEGQGLVRLSNRWYLTELNFGVIDFSYELNLVESIKVCEYFPIVITATRHHSSTLFKISNQNTFVQMHWDKLFEDFDIWKIELLPNAVAIYTLAPGRRIYRFTTGLERSFPWVSKMPYFEVTNINKLQKPRLIKAEKLPIKFNGFTEANYISGQYDAVIKITSKFVSITKVNLENVPNDDLRTPLDGL